MTAVSATAVRVSWSGSTHLSTSILYTTHCTSSGSEMTHYSNTVYPGTTSTIINIEDDLTLDFQYEHSISLHYISNSAAPEIVTTTFSFGDIYCIPMYA